MTSKAECKNLILKWPFKCKYCKKTVVMIEGSGRMFEDNDGIIYYSLKCPDCKKRTMIYP